MSPWAGGMFIRDALVIESQRRQSSITVDCYCQQIYHFQTGDMSVQFTSIILWNVESPLQDSRSISYLCE